MRYVITILLIFLFLSSQYESQVTLNLTSSNNPMFAEYLRRYEIAMFRENLDIIERDKIITSLLGSYGGNCKTFVDKWASVLGLEIGKGKFHPKFSHYFLIISETDNEWEVLDSNWRLNGIILRHIIKKY